MLNSPCSPTTLLPTLSPRLLPAQTQGSLLVAWLVPYQMGFPPIKHCTLLDARRVDMPLTGHIPPRTKRAALVGRRAPHETRPQYPGVQLSCTGLPMWRISVYPPLSSQNQLPYWLSHCVLNKFLPRISPHATAFPPVALLTFIGTMQLSDCLLYPKIRVIVTRYCDLRHIMLDFTHVSVQNVLSDYIFKTLVKNALF